MISKFIIAFFVIILPFEVSASSVTEAKLTKAKVQIEILELALYKFCVDIKRLPTSEEGLNVLIEPKGFEKNWKGPYITNRQIPKDPWDNEYIYNFPSKHGGEHFDLYSYGANKKDDFGKKDDIYVGRDIKNEFYRSSYSYWHEPVALLYMILVFDFPLALIGFFIWKLYKKRIKAQPPHALDSQG